MITRSDWRKAMLGDCVVINDNTYSPKEKWPLINYLDTSNITENRIAKIQHLAANKDKLPSRARRKVQAGDIVYSTVRPNQKHFGLIRLVAEERAHYMTRSGTDGAVGVRRIRHYP